MGVQNAQHVSWCRSGGLNYSFVFAQEPAKQSPGQPVRVKKPVATVCAIAKFGDLSVPGAPLFPSGMSALAQYIHGNIYSATPDGGEFRKGAAYIVAPDGTMTIL